MKSTESIDLYGIKVYNKSYNKCDLLKYVITKQQLAEMTLIPC